MDSHARGEQHAHVDTYGPYTHAHDECYPERYAYSRAVFDSHRSGHQHVNPTAHPDPTADSDPQPD
jgi:hypothetical protein